MSLVYSCTALQGTNKVGDLKPDCDGYYKLCLGGLNVTSSGGRFYSADCNRHIFEQSSSFMRQVSAGNLYSEEDHPKRESNWTDDQYVERICVIASHNVCAHIRKVELIPDGNNAKGEPIFRIYGWVKPDRSRGPFLKAALENAMQNVCFSLRALCNDVFIGGRWVRTITSLITFDWVIEPGLPGASKYQSVGLESHNDFTIDKETIKKVITRAEGGKVALESNRLAALRSAYELASSSTQSIQRPLSLSWK